MERVAHAILGMDRLMIHKKFRYDCPRLVTVIGYTCGVYHRKPIGTSEIEFAVLTLQYSQRIIYLPLCILTFIELHQTFTRRIITT